MAVVNANANATGLGRDERPNANTGQGRESEGPTQAVSVAGGKVFAHQKVGRLSSEYVLVLYVSAFGCEAGNDFDNLLEPFFHMRFHMRTTGTELPINRPAITRLHRHARFDDDGPQSLCIPHCCVHFSDPRLQTYGEFVTFVSHICEMSPVSPQVESCRRPTD